MATTDTKPAVKRFRVPLEKHGDTEATSFTLPFDSAKFFGTRARVAVRGTINRHPFRGTIFPTGDGRHYMVVNKTLRAEAGVAGGETISLTIELDDEPRTVEAPADFARAVESDESARAVWAKLSYTHRREYVQAINEAKRPETRARRIGKAVEALAAGRKEKYNRD
jgi:hypothetical protein